MESFEQKASFLTFFSTNERIRRKNSNKESFLIYKIKLLIIEEVDIDKTVKEHVKQDCQLHL